MSDNPFGEFEDDFKNTEKAAAAAMPGRVPPETYRFVCTSVDPKEDGNLIDHEIFVTPSGTKCFKLFCQILEPQSVPNPKTGEAHITEGVVIEHPFWITQKNLPYAKRDLSTILERDLESLGEVTSIVWAGRTFEGVVRDESYNGRVSSRIAFINPWVPPAENAAPKDVKKTDAKPDPKKAAATPAKGAAQAAKGTIPVKGQVKPARAGAKAATPAQTPGTEEDIPF